MGMICFIAFACVAVFLMSFAIYRTRKALKSLVEFKDYGNFFTRQLFIILASSIAFTMMFISIYWWTNISPTTSEWIASIAGSYFFTCFGQVCLHSFMLHYYMHNIPKEIDKWLFRILLASFLLTVIFIFVTTDGYADHIAYPLINGFNFSYGVGYPLSMYGNGHTSDIAFYALCILSGAFYSYFIVDHEFYKEYGKHGMADSTLVVGLLSGIIGARLFYVLGEWDYYRDLGFGAMIDLHSGGLTILGGAPTGILIGGLWLHFRNKDKDILHMLDLVAPTILVAQAIGRWGNFFNLEVHGLEVSKEYFWWLPKFVVNNMQYSAAYDSSLHAYIGQASEGMIYLPLFIIEAMVNLLGYFTLGHLFGNKLRKYTKPGDILASYVMWYGMTRVLLEPLRHPSYNMGQDGYWSWFWSLIFVVGGALLILVNHIIRYFIDKKKERISLDSLNKKRSLISILVFASLAIIFVTCGAILMASSSFTMSISYNKFNIGLIFLVSGVSLFVFMGNPLINLIYLKKHE